MQDLIETWEINNRINLYLVRAIAENHFTAVAASKGRTVGEQLAHIHNVRIMWLQQAYPELVATLTKLDKGSIDKKVILEQLEKSGGAISQLLQKGFSEGRIKGFKPHPTAFMGYIIAHEAHHRGQIVLSLKQAGYSVDKKILFGLWEWGTK